MSSSIILLSSSFSTSSYLILCIYLSVSLAAYRLMSFSNYSFILFTSAFSLASYSLSYSISYICSYFHSYSSYKSISFLLSKSSISLVTLFSYYSHSFYKPCTFLFSFLNFEISISSSRIFESNYLYDRACCSYALVESLG